MVYSEALELAAPFINLANAQAYDAEIDKMIWVEDNIMSPAGIHSSINSGFGELVCEAIEIRLSELLLDEAFKQAEAEDYFRDMRASVEQRIAYLQGDLELEAQSNSIVSHSWVVVMPMVGCMKFDLGRIPGTGQFIAVGGEPTNKVASRSNRYVKEDAIKLAADCVNGADERGVAMHWTDAAKAELAKNLEALEVFKSIPD